LLSLFIEKRVVSLYETGSFKPWEQKFQASETKVSP
jgi:hypothetical protein